jgi:hypothetical protein
MGALKQLEIADQEQVDRLAAWYRWHQDKLPASYIQWLLKDEELLWKTIEHWETVPYAPVPARRHVALQSRDHIRQERADKRYSRRETVLIIAGLLVALAGITFGLVSSLEVL